MMHLNCSERSDAASNGIETDQEKKGHLYRNCGRTMHVSIIDYLQEYNLSKKGERFIKTMILQKNADGLSSIDPTRYGRRF